MRYRALGGDVPVYRICNICYCLQETLGSKSLAKGCIKVRFPGEAETFLFTTTSVLVGSNLLFTKYIRRNENLRLILILKMWAVSRLILTSLLLTAQAQVQITRKLHSESFRRRLLSIFLYNK